MTRQDSIRTMLAITVLVATLPLSMAAEGSPRELSFEERVRAQLAIERVYHAHRTGTTRSLESDATPEVLAGKVRNYLARSLALEQHWKRPVTAEMLEREVGRMVRQSKMPGRLVELFDALGNDPVLIQECLARKTLVDRLVASYLRNDERIPTSTPDGAEGPHQDLVTEPVAPEQTLDTWLQEFMDDHVGEEVASVASADLASTLSRLAAAPADDPTGCSTGVWRPLAPTTPTARRKPLAVWTGAEMIVPADQDDSTSFAERYDPATDTWSATSTTSALAGRADASAVWTGTEMIVWGGRSWDDNTEFFRSEGRAYDPLTDTWRSISSNDEPEPRAEQTAVWTGSTMIVWGGTDESGVLATGGIYDPLADSWSPVSTVGAPSTRQKHTAVWSGTEMIVWGGEGTTYLDWLDTGARYEPGTDTWTPTATVDAPSSRWGHTAIWTGSTMIVWGGGRAGAVKTGSIYDPATDRWSRDIGEGAPNSRFAHTAVWTGTEMIVWGGVSTYPNGTEYNNGGRYDPATRSWSLTWHTNDRSRFDHVAVWTGSEMIVWGGTYAHRGQNSGDRYEPVTDSWVPTARTLNGAPTSQGARSTMEALWTGAEMLVWAVWTGSSGRYDPVTDTWSPISAVDAPQAGQGQAIVWTGDEMIAWAGGNEAGIYNPTTDVWKEISTANAPHYFGGASVAFWTGTEMLLWGDNPYFGYRGHSYGARYNPNTDTWVEISWANAPTRAWGTAGVWTGTEMIVWGGTNGEDVFMRGGRYDPVTDTWTTISTNDEPPRTVFPTAVWTGSEMIVWGGARITDPTVEPEDKASGGRYDPATDTWTTISTVDVPTARLWHDAVWTGNEMIVWGGGGWNWYPPDEWESGSPLRTGGHYDPVTDRWWPSAVIDAPIRRRYLTALWTGEEMLVWGGRENGYNSLSSGGIYGASLDLDEDGYCSPADCDEADPTIHHGAPEINDGMDNQCPGDPGHGAVDEISGAQAFSSDGLLSWIPQAGATLYQVARSDASDFSVNCATVTTPSNSYDTSLDSDPTFIRYYLVRALAPNAGSWGLRFSGAERTVSCE